MTLSHNLVTLSVSTPTILTIPAQQEADYSQSLTISIQNLHATHFVYLGSSSVSTTSYGFRIDPGQTWTSDLHPEDEIWAVTDTGTTNVGIIKVAH
jgi:hypothetical protein